jgi:hypothetical protein
MKIARHLIGRFIYRTGYPIGSREETASLIMIEPEKQDKAYHLKKDEKTPIVVFQEEIQQIAHGSMMYEV